MDQQSPFPPAEHGDDSTAQHDTATTTPPEPPRRRHRLVATLAATALVAGVGGVGIGYGVSRGLGSDATTSASSGTQQGAEQGDGAGGVQLAPGWSFSDGTGPGDLQVPTDPFGEGRGGTGGTPDATANTQKATASQVTGLVRIVSTMKYAGARGAGTGMILTSNGEVVTNHHVVEGATSVKAKVMSTGKTYTATVVGTDAKDDVAVLQLQGASGLSTVTTDSDGVSVGDPVTAVGDANGTVDHLTAASGKVTALNDSITTQSEGTAQGERLTGLLKISSDVISGDSGGATYDEDGEVVGMTTAASSGGAEIDGYAVPIAKVMRIVDDLDSGVASSRYDYDLPAFLGVGLSETSATVQGVYRGTPAAEAGLEAGDRITAVGPTKVSTTAQLQAAVAKLSPGDDVSITWTDSTGATQTRTVTLGTGAVE